MKFFFTLLLNILVLSTFSQEKKQSAFTFGYAHQLPIGDLAKRFGENSSIGCSFFIEKENNFFYGLEASYMFGNNVNDSVIFDNITTSDGALIGADGHYINMNLMERGFASYLFIGYAIHTKKSNIKHFPYLHNLTHINLTGFYFSTGFGFLQHQIFIDTKNQNIPQLSEQYKKGYDYLTNGVSTKWDASYKYYSPNGKFQMYTGIEMTLAYTKNKRPYLFDQMEYTPTERRWDKLVGANIGIIIPVNRRNEEKFHYY